MNKTTGSRKWTLRLAGLAMALIFVLGATGCALNGTTTDMNQAIAKVGSHKVTYGEFNALYESYVSTYASYGYDIKSDPSAVSYLQSSILNSLVQEKVLLYQAEKQGLTKLSAEQQAELDQRVKDQLASINDYYRSTAEAEATGDNFDVDARIEELIKQEAEYYYPGENYTAQQYLDTLSEKAKETYYSDLLRESVISDVTVSDEEVTKWYDENLEAVKKEYADDAALYLEDMEEFETYAGQPVLYAPAGFSRIMDILITPEEEPSDEYTNNLTELDTIKSECGELYIEQANGTDHSARIAELVKEYNELKAKTDQMETERFAAAKADIDAAYAKLQSGTPFADVMAEYTHNTNFTSTEAYKKNGMLISEGDEQWSEAVHEQFKALKVGEYSEVFKDEDGYHIIYFVSIVAEGATPLEDVKDAVHEYLLIQKQDEEWEACITEWSADGSVVIDTNRLAKLGISTTDLSDDGEAVG